MVSSFLLTATMVGAEPRPGRESDVVLPISDTVRAFNTTAAGVKFIVASGGGNGVIRLSATNTIDWTLPTQSVQNYSHVDALPDGTAFALRVRPFFFPGVSRADLVRLTGTNPDVASVSLSGDPEPDFFNIFPLIAVAPGGVAVDAARERIYTAHTRQVITTESQINIQINVYDRNLSLLRQRSHVFELTGGFGDVYGVFVDAQGFVWVVGLEYPAGPGARRLFVERHPPDLADPPIVQRLTLGAAFSGTLVAAGDPRGGVVVASDSGFIHRASSYAFSASFPQAGFTGGPMAVEADGSLYIGGQSGGLPAFTKLTPSNVPAWSPASISLNPDRIIEALWTPVPGTIDVAGTVAIPLAADEIFLSRYKQGAGTGGRLKAISPLEETAIVNSNLTTPIMIEVKDESNLAKSNVDVGFHQGVVPDAAVGYELIAPELKTNALGRAKTGFKIGDLPLEYEIKADCPSCASGHNSIVFRACGVLPVTVYRQNNPKLLSEGGWGDALLDHHPEGAQIKDRGCALTAFTMLLNIFRERYNLSYPDLAAGTDYTPGTLNKQLETVDGFGDDGGVYFKDAAPRSTGGQVQLDLRRDIGTDFSLQDALAKVDQSLAAGNPALLWKPSGSDAGHYVTVVGRCGTRYIFADPWGEYPAIGFVDTAINGQEILGIRTFKRGN